MDSAQKYSLRKLTLRFVDDDTESAYVDSVLERTLLYCRISWGLVIVLGGSFGVLDQRLFGAEDDTVLALRLGILGLAAVVLVASFVPGLRRRLVFSSALFILSVGIFCSVLMGLSDRSVFTPYFTGLFFAFAGFFTTAGLGFRYSVLALLVNLVVFEVIVGWLMPVTSELLIVYNFFLPGIIIVFTYVGYLVERTSRESYIVSTRLLDSLSQVKNLSGLLPICASCKKIRDDKGYWKQIETYIREHSEADFSHGICPDCTKDLYPQRQHRQPDPEG